MFAIGSLVRLDNLPHSGPYIVLASSDRNSKLRNYFTGRELTVSTDKLHT